MCVGTLSPPPLLPASLPPLGFSLCQWLGWWSRNDDVRNIIDSTPVLYYMYTLTHTEGFVFMYSTKIVCLQLLVMNWPLRRVFPEFGRRSISRKVSVTIAYLLAMTSFSSTCRFFSYWPFFFNSDGLMTLSDFAALCRTLFRNEQGKAYAIEENRLQEMFDVFDQNQVWWKSCIFSIIHSLVLVSNFKIPFFNK